MAHIFFFVTINNVKVLTFLSFSICLSIYVSKQEELSVLGLNLFPPILSSVSW